MTDKPLLIYFFYAVATLISASAYASRPNVIIIFTDDMGINDIGAYAYPTANPYPASGPTPIDNSNAGGQSRLPLPGPNEALGLTPNIDSLATDGMKFTSFYASSPVCTPSRASLMTGSYATRVRLESVILHDSNIWGLHSEEVTLAERLKQRGYTTQVVGKWHLGTSIDFRPTRHGFDEFFGTATSHDLWPWHANPTFAATLPDLPVYDGENEMVGTYTTATGGNLSSPLNKSTKTASFLNSSYLLEAMTEKSLDFIDAAHSANQPFFIFFSSHVPHTPCIPHPDFDGDSGVSAYYDVMMELDHRVGQILTKLDDLGIDDNTLILFTSDNGPFITRPGPTEPDSAVGSAYPYRGYKRVGYEGGLRLPLLARFPGQIAPGSVEDGLASNIDIFHTVLNIADGEVPNDRTLDGVDLWPLMTGSVANSPRSEFFYYEDGDADAVGVRQGDWKYIFSSLYDLSTDIQEQTNVAGSNSSTVSSLASAISSHNSSMDSSRRSRGLPESNQIEIRKSAAEPDNTNTVIIDEGGTATFEVRLANSANATVTISHFSGDSDLSVQSGASLSFTTGNYDVWQTVTLAAATDADTDEDGATFRASSGSMHVREIFALENEIPPNPNGNIALSSDSYNSGEGDGTVTISVERAGGSTGTVSIDYTTSNGTATAGSDYTTASGTLTWTDSDSADKTFDITITDDGDTEGTEALSVTLSSPTGGASLNIPSTATVTIVDNDTNLLFYEGFNYSLASTLTANGWTAFSSSTTAESGTIGSGLTFGSGNALTVTGGAAELSVTSGGSNFRNAGWQSPDFGGGFAAINSGTVWRSQLFRPTSDNAAGSGANESIDTNILRYDVAVDAGGNANRIPGSTSNDTQERKFTLNPKNFNGTGVSGAWAHNEGNATGTNALSQNTTYLLVSKYDFATKTATIWVFDESTGQAVLDARASGSISETTLDAAVASNFKIVGAAGTENISLSPDDSLAINFGFNNNDSTTAATLDEFRLGISLDDVVPVALVAPTPDAASSLSATAVSSTQIDLAWTDNSSNETGFKVQRSSTSGSGFATVTTTAADASSFSDTGLAAGTTYFYQVIATNGAGDSAASNEASATTWSPAQSWRDQYFDQIDNTGDAADDFDFDEGGTPNLLERAFGTNPTDSSDDYTPSESMVDVSGTDHLGLTYRRLAGGSGTTGVDYTVDNLTYTVEYDGDLTPPWSFGGITVVSVQDDTPAAGLQTVTVRLNSSVGSTTKQFVRLQVDTAE